MPPRKRAASGSRQGSEGRGGRARAAAPGRGRGKARGGSSAKGRCCFRASNQSFGPREQVPSEVSAAFPPHSGVLLSLGCCSAWGVLTHVGVPFELELASLGCCSARQASAARVAAAALFRGR